MRFKFLLPAVALFLLFASCQKDEIVSGFPSGTYYYVALDTNQAVVVTGTMTINAQDSLHVTGSWWLQCKPGRTDVGPQSGIGKLGGQFLNSRLLLNLNPGYVDNNVLLSGTYTTGRYAGSWRWIGFPGELNHGTFTATR